MDAVRVTKKKKKKKRLAYRGIGECLTKRQDKSQESMSRGASSSSSGPAKLSSGRLCKQGFVT